VWLILLALLAANRPEVPPTIEVRDGTPVKQQYLRGKPAYLAVGVLAGVSGTYRESGAFDKVYLFRQGTSKEKGKYQLVGTYDLGFVNGVPAGLDLAGGDVDGDKKDELGVSVRRDNGLDEREIGMILLRPSADGLNEIWHLYEGAPQLTDLDGDGRAEVGQFGKWEGTKSDHDTVRYLDHIYRWKGNRMALDDIASVRIFHTARERARNTLEIILAGKGNSDGAFNAAAEVLLVGKKDNTDLGKVWRSYEKALKKRLSGEQWSALQKIKP
jgi:hypothetical protein